MQANADVVAEYLRERGVRYAFGIPSGQLLALVEGLRKVGIEFTLVSHEAAAGFMADVWGRLTGVPGVCISTLGPGATNMSTGVGNAFLDRSPVVAIAAQDPVANLERRVQMRVDHRAIFKPITKAGLRLTPGTIRAQLQAAFDLAVAEPPGPVHLDLPADVAAAPAEEYPSARVSIGRKMLLGTPMLDDMADILSAARKPLVALGLSVLRSRALPELLSFIEKQQVPFVTTLMAKGAVPEDHPLLAGVVGRARKDLVAGFCKGADLVVGIGYDPVEICYEDWMPQVPLVHIDFEPADVAPSVRVEREFVGDLSYMIRELAKLPPRGNAWSREEIGRHKEALYEALTLPSKDLTPHHVLESLRDILPSEGIMSCDVGAHTHLIGQLWRVPAPGKFLVSNGWSSMGFGVPAATAAKLARPDLPVVAVVGDGGFRMMAGEMATARRLNVAVLFVVLNDGFLTLIREKQRARNLPACGVQITRGAYEPPEHYFGVPVRVVRTVEDLVPALRDGLDADGPTVIEALVNPAEYETMRL